MAGTSLTSAGAGAGLDAGRCVEPAAKGRIRCFSPTISSADKLGRWRRAHNRRRSSRALQHSFQQPLGGSMARTRVAVLISGRGSNMAALIEAAKDPSYPAEIALVVSNRPEAAGLAHAQAQGIATAVVDHRPHGKDRSAFERALQGVLDEHRVQLVCLGGFMRLFTAPFALRWEGRMLNIHPSLLPSFPGLDPHGQALCRREVSGATVHFVVPETDAARSWRKRRCRSSQTMTSRRSRRACSRPSIGSTRWRSLWSRPRASGSWRRCLLEGTNQAAASPADAREQMTEKQNPGARPGATGKTRWPVNGLPVTSGHLEIFRRCLAAIGHELVLDSLTFVERAEPSTLDRRDVDEHVLVSGREGRMNP